MSRDSDNLRLTRTPLEIFPVEVWDIILSIVRQAAEYYGIPDGTEHARFVTILPVSRAWAELAIPHLYHEVIAEDLTTLERLASLLLLTPCDHPRWKWIRRIEYLQARTMRLNSEQQHILGHALKTIFSHSRLHRFVAWYHDVIPSIIMVLADASSASLTHLDLSIGYLSIGNLCVIPRFSNLRTLQLNISLTEPAPEGFDSSINPFKDIGPLCLRQVCDFSWCWQGEGDFGRVAGLCYLAACEFSEPCTFYIGYDDPIPAAESSLLNPLFLRHRSKCVTAEMSFPPNSTVLERSEEVLFELCMPPVELFDNVARLPHTISIQLEHEEDSLDTLWGILECIVKSPHTYETCIQMATSYRSLPEWPPFRWAMKPDPAMSKEDMLMALKMVYYAQLLAPKGITVADTTGKVFPCDVMSD